jgi:DNA-binding Xre family transcriptional regulator
MDTSDFPRNLIEFEERFGTEAACLAYVRGKKWPEGFRCSKCGGRASWPVRGGRQEECQGCGHQESVTAGTMFHLTHKSLRLWFRAIMLWVVSKRAMSAKELSRQLGIHYETAWTWCHKLRACVGTAFGQEALHGVVELDESYIGGTDDRAHKGRSLAGCKALIGGAVEVLASGKMGRIRLEHLAAADAKSLESFAVRNIEQHAVARTDGLASYNNLPMVGIGHQRNVIGPDSAKAVEVLPNIHKVFSLFKRVLLGTFQGSVSHKHLWAYLDEFVFRFNRRNSDNRWLLFERIVTAAPRSRPPTMTQIIHRAEAPT